MQEDMHYYGSLAMALAAGIPKNDAEVIAYAAQFVDDSTRFDSMPHNDGGLLLGIGTAHHPLQAFLDVGKERIGGMSKLEEQRRIWVAFHFLPGGAGDCFSEQLICGKDSYIVNHMLDNHLHVAKEKPYRLELLGIAAHVYMDTFSHYGFSGISSVYNTIKKNTIEFIEKPATYDYITKQFDRFIQKYTGEFAQRMSMALGHGGVATYPDRPYLKWKFEFTRSRPGNGLVSIRDNQSNFLNGCEKLHGFLSKFAQHRYGRQREHKPFREIKDIVKSVISVEADREGRVKAWRNSGLIDNCSKYDAGLWENEKNTFNSRPTSKEGIETNAYRFHQAAAYHRYYVLKDLLPSHGIAVY